MPKFKEWKDMDAHEKAEVLRNNVRDLPVFLREEITRLEARIDEKLKAIEQGIAELKAETPAQETSL